MSRLQFLFLLVFCVSSVSRVSGGCPQAGNFTISNDFYSVTIPAGWIPFPPGGGDGITPDVRNSRSYQCFTIQWHTPMDKENYSDGYSFILQSFKKKEGNAFVTPEDLMAELEMTASASAEVKDVKWHALEAPEGQKRFMIERLAPAIRAGRGVQMQKERIFSLLQAEKGMGHLMLLFVTDTFYREHPEAEQIILKIMDSFKTTGYGSPACHRGKP